MNTGCGANADTRTKKLVTLQHSFFQHHQAGVLPETQPSDDWTESHSFPSDVIRATMLLRCNSLLRGHSAVRIEIIEFLLTALSHDILPLIPRRGSISASGDLAPLSYVGGLLEGNSDIFVRTTGEDGKVAIVPAPEALARVGLKPMKLRAKEGLGLMNGTAVSAGAAALVLYESHNLALLTQLTVAMAAEAMQGTSDNYNDFISQCRPHSGQAEVACNIRNFLTGSKLAVASGLKSAGNVQDGYSLRTASQWIGPQLEDLLLADRQLAVELNSTTDNPLIDVLGDRFHHGGNFQAASVTSAMEKTRTALTMLGRLHQAFSGELVNPVLNKGLPPNLCADDPSISFTAKGIDVNMTAYFSELAFLANSVASHVQTAELNNQPINSLALISARYTAQSVEIVSIMCAASLYMLCQAMDLRALNEEFFAAAKVEAIKAYSTVFRGCYSEPQNALRDAETVWLHIKSSWLDTTKLDLSDRCSQVAARSVGHIINDLTQSWEEPLPVISLLRQWKDEASDFLNNSYRLSHSEFIESPSTPKYLSTATKEMYLFVRKELDIPLHRGVEDHPIELSGNSGEAKKTLGFYITKIYKAIRDQSAMRPLRNFQPSDKAVNPNGAV